MSLFIVIGIYLLYCIYSLYKFKKILNPYVLETYLIFLMIALPQGLKLILGISETGVVLHSDLALLCYFFFALLGTQTSIKPIEFGKIVNVSFVNLFNWSFFILFLLPIIPMFFSFSFSIQGIRNFYETVVFSRFASFFELSKFFLYIILIYRLVQIQRISWSVWIWTPFFFLYGSKFAVFDFFMLLLLFLEYFKGISFKKFFFYSGCVALLMIFYRYMQSRSNETDIWVTALSYFDQYKNQSYLIERLMNGDAEYYHGKIYWSSYLKYIPRFLWEEKPRDFGFAILNWDFYPKEAASGYMPAFGLGATFADFGFFSVAVIAYTSGVIRRYFYNAFIRNKTNISFFLFALPFTLPSFLVLLFNLTVDKAIQTWGRLSKPVDS